MAPRKKVLEPRTLGLPPARPFRAMTTEDEKRLLAICAWVQQTCDFFGARPSTGMKCAAAFYDGLRWEWEHPEVRDDS